MKFESKRGRGCRAWRRGSCHHRGNHFAVAGGHPRGAGGDEVDLGLRASGDARGRGGLGRRAGVRRGSSPARPSPSSAESERKRVPSPASRARRYTRTAATTSASASPRLQARVRCAAAVRPGFWPVTSSAEPSACTDGSWPPADLRAASSWFGYVDRADQVHLGEGGKAPRAHVVHAAGRTARSQPAGGDRGDRAAGQWPRRSARRPSPPPPRGPSRGRWPPHRAPGRRPRRTRSHAPGAGRTPSRDGVAGPPGTPRHGRAPGARSRAPRGSARPAGRGNEPRAPSTPPCAAP